MGVKGPRPPAARSEFCRLLCPKKAIKTNQQEIASNPKGKLLFYVSSRRDVFDSVPLIRNFHFDLRNRSCYLKNVNFNWIKKKITLRTVYNCCNVM